MPVATSRPSLLALLACSSVVGLVACEPMPGSGTSSTSSSSSSSSGGSPGSASGRSPIASDALCTRLVDECKVSTTKGDCVRSFTGVLVTSTCASAISGARCADLTAAKSSVLTTCFPPCSGTLAQCNGDDTITVCTAAGATNVLDCAAACQADGARTYSGTCGTAYEGQVADRPQCWCK